MPSELQAHEQSKFGAIGCCALDVAVLSNFTGSDKWQETPHESSRTSAENSRGSTTAWTLQRRSSTPTPWLRQGNQGPSKPRRAEDRRLLASRSISGGGSRNRIAAVDARWQVGQGRHRGLVAGRKTATEGTSLAECRSLDMVRPAILGPETTSISTRRQQPTHWQRRASIGHFGRMTIRHG
jgi:hypothetical protein